MTDIDCLPRPLHRAMLRWQAWCYRKGIERAATIYRQAGIPHRAWCELCGLPVPTISTPNPPTPPQPCELTTCLLESHARFHRIEAT